MIKNPLKIFSKGLSLKSFTTKFGILMFLLGFSLFLIFIAGIVSLLGTFWTNIK